MLVSMTRTRGTRRRTESRTSQWALQDAKARFSEVVRKAKTEGPQRITVHGREEVVVVSVEEFRRVKGEPTGEALVKLLHDFPLRNISMDRDGTRSPVRGVEL
jgi:prevent-host-death family protein